jgi:hypothetical protein
LRKTWWGGSRNGLRLPNLSLELNGIMCVRPPSNPRSISKLSRKA